jgi:hypothetical protein
MNYMLIWYVRFFAIGQSLILFAVERFIREIYLGHLDWGFRLLRSFRGSGFSGFGRCFHDATPVLGYSGLVLPLPLEVAKKAARAVLFKFCCACH